MTYDPGIPNPTDTLSTSQGQIKTNFGQINTVFTKNHFAFDDAIVANRGKHNFVTIPVRNADPGGLSASEIALFCENISLGNPATETELVMKRGGGNRIYLSGPEPDFGANNGSTFLPGKLLLQYGKKTASPGSNTFAYHVNFSSPAFSVVLTIDTTGTGDYQMYVTNIQANTFDVQLNASSGKDFRWIAIGPQ